MQRYYSSQVGKNYRIHQGQFLIELFGTFMEEADYQQFSNIVQTLKIWQFYPCPCIQLHFYLEDRGESTSQKLIELGMALRSIKETVGKRLSLKWFFPEENTSYRELGEELATLLANTGIQLDIIPLTSLNWSYKSRGRLDQAVEREIMEVY